MASLTTIEYNDLTQKEPRANRITFVLNGSRPGGYQGQFLSYARRMAAGHQLSIVFVFPVDMGSPIIQEFESLGVRVHSLGVRARISAKSIFRTYQIFLSTRPQIIHSQHPIAGVNAKIAGWFYKRHEPSVKIICEQRNVPEGLSWIARRLEYLTFPAADVVLCSSTQVERRYFGSSKVLDPDNFNLDRRKHYTFYNSIDTDFAAAAKVEAHQSRAFLKREWGIESGDFVFVTVAKFTKQKDYPTLISGFAKARQMAPGRTLKLICVGDGPEMAPIQGLAQRQCIEAHVIFAGYRADVPRILSGVDCFVLTSLWEGLPKALLEAMAIPLPCVATEVSGTEDVIRHEVDGILIPPADATACASALVRVVEDQSLCQTLKARASERVASFSAKRQVEVLLRLYDQLHVSAMKVT